MTIRLLVLQPTPFCNINCSYCYLPTRDDSSRMSMDTLRAAICWVFDAGLVGEELSIVWHAGEPTVLGPDYYRDAFAVIRAECPERVRVRHSFQTNGTLIDERWCAFIAEYDVNVGLSIDGPDWLHNHNRKTRSGRGTHAAAMRGLSLLRAHKLPLHAICVLTRESLKHPDAIFDFFVESGVTDLGFNIEEVEAANTQSSLSAAGVESEFENFFARVLDRLRAAPNSLRIREVADVVSALCHPAFGKLKTNCQNQPWAILSIAHDGSIGTFSPELLGLRDPRYGLLSFGNVHVHTFVEISRSERFRSAAEEINTGLAACRRSCPYFDFCRGGAPANKLAENGTFASTETLYCRLTQKVLIECVLSALERDLSRREMSALTRQSVSAASV